LVNAKPPLGMPEGHFVLYIGNSGVLGNGCLIHCINTQIGPTSFQTVDEIKEDLDDNMFQRCRHNPYHFLQHLDSLDDTIFAAKLSRVQN